MDDTQTEFERIVAGFQPTSLPCERPGHGRGLDGCEQAQPAGHILGMHRCGEPGVPARALICQGAAIALRSNAGATRSCLICGKRGVLSDFMAVVGPIADA
jgi:hypothetical protein